MAAITSAVVVAAGTAYSARQQSNAARSAARTQANSVRDAQQETQAATSRARSALMGGNPYAGVDYNTPQPQNIPGQTAQPGSANQQPESSFSNSVSDAVQYQGPPQQTSPMGYGDPYQNYMAGLGAQSQFVNQGYAGSNQTLSPLAQMAQPYLSEQANLLGMGGNEAYQDALSRVADPLAAEQERAILRNNAALGGVGGNVLSALADQTRARTEANIGNRLSQLSTASSPSLSALQQISNNRLNQGLNMGNIFGGAGYNLAQLEENRRRALANLEVGQGSQMAQLSQNYGNAAAGGDAYAAQNAPALSQGLASGINAYMGAGGSNPFSGIADWYGQYQLNQSSGYGNIGDPFESGNG